MPSRTSASVRADIPRTVRSRPVLGGARRSSTVSIAELGVELADRLRTEPRDLEHLDEGRRDLRPQLVVDGHVAGRDELADLVADGLADARDRRRVARPIRRHEVDRAAPDRVGRAVVGDGLEHELALELEHVADLVEDPGEVAVGQFDGLGGLAAAAARLTARAFRCVGHRRWSARAAMVVGQAATTRSRPARLAR